jgi:lipoate-protein ligase A
MAVDEALLAAAVEEGIATLRLYQWNEPTLSLGYFQRYDDRRQHPASSDCAVVRRQTGGGAILHDRELTYSLTLPAGHPLARDATALYAAVHEAFIRQLAPRLQSAATAGSLVLNEDQSPLAAGDEPFLCFQRRSRGDLLLVRDRDTQQTNRRPLAYKLLGSAQRRHRGAILQHGSLLLGQSPAAPELPGWQELTKGEAPVADLIAGLPQQLASVLTNRLEAASLPAAIRDAARQIERSKYGDWSWTGRR